MRCTTVEGVSEVSEVSASECISLCLCLCVLGRLKAGFRLTNDEIVFKCAQNNILLANNDTCTRAGEAEGRMRDGHKSSSCMKSSRKHV